MSQNPSERNATFQLKRALKAEDECRALQARVMELNKVVTALKGDLTQRTTDLMLATAELAAARAQEPVSYRYKFTHPISGEPVWRDSSPMWNGQCVQEVQPLFAAPVPPLQGQWIPAWVPVTERQPAILPTSVPWLSKSKGVLLLEGGEVFSGALVTQGNVTKWQNDEGERVVPTHWMEKPPATLPTTPVRDPLTSEQIQEWWECESGLEDIDMCKIDDFTKFVRKVEAAIKEQGK